MTIRHDSISGRRGAKALPRLVWSGGECYRGTSTRASSVQYSVFDLVKELILVESFSFFATHMSTMLLEVV